MEAVTDAAHYAGENISSIIYGPTGDSYHGPDENVNIESIYETIKVLISTVLEWNDIN